MNRIFKKPPQPDNPVFFLSLCLFLSITPILLAQAAEPSWTDPASDGDLTVEHIDTVFHDTARSKDLELQISYPQKPGCYPIILFSHGAGGSRNAAQPLVSYWASHGYVVISPTHADSIELYRRQHPEEVDQWRKDGGRLFMASLLREIGRSPEDWKQRAADITFILDNLDTIAESFPDLNGKLDFSSIGMSGHSYGAYTTMLIGGATITPPGMSSQVSYADQRPDALLVLSGQGVGRLGLRADSWSDFHRPMMVMSGNLDSAAGGMDVESRRDPYDYAPPEDKYLVWIEDAFHASFTGGLASPSATDRAQSRWVEWVLGNASTVEIDETDQVAVFNCVKSASIAYWDYYLKGDVGAGVWLTEDNLVSTSGAAIEFTSK